MPLLEWRDLTRVFDQHSAVSNVSLTVEEGETVAILGPSGSGKSTLLRLTAGLDTPTAGSVLLDGADVRDVPAHRRGIGLMFQEYCLFPHLSVAGNIAFGLRMQRMPPGQRRRRVEDLLRIVRLEGFGSRDVHSLSGGEQQRVALARSLAPAPRVLMLDEPLGALDVALRGALLEDISRILRDVRVTVLWVTHDHDEALSVADRVALIDRGRIVQAASPGELVERPSHPFVAEFLGLGCLVKGRLERRADGPFFSCGLGDIPVPCSGKDSRGGAAVLLVRPTAVSTTGSPGAVRVRARVVATRTRTSGTVARLELGGVPGQEMEVPMSGQTETGSVLDAWIDGRSCRVLPPSRL